MIPQPIAPQGAPPEMMPGMPGMAGMPPGMPPPGMMPPEMMPPEPDNSMFGVPGIPDSKFQGYAKMLGVEDLNALPPEEGEPLANEILLLAKIDDVFKQVYIEYKIFKKRGKGEHDRIIWEAHQVFMQAPPEMFEEADPPRDPIEDYPEAREELIARLGKLQGGEEY